MIGGRCFLELDSTEWQACNLDQKWLVLFDVLAKDTKIMYQKINNLEIWNYACSFSLSILSSKDNCKDLEYFLDL